MDGIKRTMWGFGTPRTLRPLWALAELGLTYNHKKIAPRSQEMEDPQLISFTTRHKVPFFDDDRVTIGESAAIVNYLADRYGGDVLRMPAPGTKERATLMDRTMYMMTEIDARLYTTRLHGEPPLGLPTLYGSSPVAVEAAEKYVRRGLDEAAHWLADGRQFVMGEHFGTADILLVTCLNWALMVKIRLPLPLEEYRNRLAARPAYIEAKTKNALPVQT